MLEREFKIKVIRELKKLPNLWVYKSNDNTTSGLPDLIGVINSRFIGIELKRDVKAKVSKLQAYNIELIKAAGGYACVCYPENLEQVIKEVREL